MDWLGPLRGKVIRMVLAEGRTEYGSVSVEVGSNVNFIVSSWPVVLVAA